MGWVPHPKAAKTRFNNEILPTFYEASYPVVDDRRFKKDFIAERNRAFAIREKIDKYDSKLLFIRGDNPAAGGRFLKADFNIKSRHDLVTCETNLDKTDRVIAEIKKEIENIQDHDNSLFRKDGIRLRAGQESKHAYNMQAKARMMSLISCAESDHVRLEAALQKLKTFFSSEYKDAARAKRMKRQAKRRALKKKALRREKQEKVLIEAIFPESSDPDVPQVCINAVTELNHQQGTCLYSLLKRLNITAESHAMILANLSKTGRQGYQAAHLSHHATCTGECDSEDCPFFERAATLFRSLGGQTHRNTYAPSVTGLPQLGMAELERDVFENAASTPELAHLLSIGCFAEEVEQLIKAL